MTDHIIVTDDGFIRTIQFNRPEKKNAILHAMYAKITDAMRDADVNPSIRVIVFKGTPGSFTAGNDMMDFVKGQRPEAKPHADSQPVRMFLKALPEIQTPMVAIVDGIAVGVGVTMLMHCDLVYCSPNASFMTPFTALGLVPEAASSLLMPAAIGHQQAAELLLLSKPINAKDALRMGFVTRVFKASKLEKKAKKEIDALAALPPSAVREAKRLMRRLPEPVADRMAVEGKAFSARLSSEEFTEAASAFMSRRKPDFSKFK
ncbi:MAG: enoyl-CoA hydratase [Acidimicrobiales bacterium]|nr:enoyl-CoA hydratase [Hyphomonadaceae bacterium]RZV42490.1 MAG: enoyl-CoA hydratase [Acidimicrobiales bacterium]